MRVDRDEPILLGDERSGQPAVRCPVQRRAAGGRLDRAAFGASEDNNVDAAAGVRAWDQQARIVLRIGPLDLPYFERLLPHRPLLRELASLVRAFVGFEVGFAVNPVLARDAVPPLVLSRPDATDALGGGPLLGWNTWLPTSPIIPRRTDASEPLFEGDIVEGLA